MFLGRVITTSKNIKLLDFIEKTDDLTKADGTLPTLIVGKAKAIEIFGKENVHILNRKLMDNVYWTYSKMEKRTVFESDIAKFSEAIEKTLEKSVKYYYFNIFTEPLSSVKKFIKFMRGKSIKYVYIKNDHAYIYGGKSVIGFSLRDTDYIGIDRSKVIGKIKKNPNNILITDDFLSESTKKTINNVNIMVPYLYFMMKQE